MIIILAGNQKHSGMWKERTNKNPKPPETLTEQNLGNSHLWWPVMHFCPGFIQTTSSEMLQSGPRLHRAAERASGEASAACRCSSAPLCPQLLCAGALSFSSKDSGRYLMVNEMTLALMYSNLFSNCVYECPTLCVCACGRVCIFRFRSPFETRFLFPNIKPKLGWQMVLELAVLSLSCALLKRLVCPMHPTMPWRYQHFVFWLSSHHHFST